MALLAGEYWYFEAQRLDDLYGLEWLKNANHDKKEIIYLDNERQYKKIMESQGEKIDDLESWVNNKYLWFGLGVLTTGLTVYLVK